MNANDKRFKTAVLVLLLAILASVFFLAYYNQDDSVDSVAYVNLERVFAEHPARTAAEKKLNNKAAEYQQQLETKAEKLSGAEQKELLKKYQNQLKNLEKELLDSVLKEVENIIVQTAGDKKVKFVMEAEDVLYGGHNLTDDVLHKIEADW